MKILIVGDVHYPREPEIFLELLKLLTEKNPDILAICGDIINAGNKELLRKFLAKVHKKKRNLKVIAVMGNHDFWLSKAKKRCGWTSWMMIDVYKEVFEYFGDFLLWDEPFTDEIEIAGVPGWYDFSFGPWNMFTKEDFIRGILDNYIWNDVIYTNFQMDVEDVLKVHLQKLDKQLSKIKSNNAIVLLHLAHIDNFALIKFSES